MKGHNAKWGIKMRWIQLNLEINPPEERHLIAVNYDLGNVHLQW